MAYDDLKISTGTVAGWGTLPQSNVCSIGAATQISAASNQYVYASNGTTGAWSNTSITASQAAILELQGKGADVRINGVSLTGVLKNIEERLNILRPNAELETEWHQLRELGDQYRRLEAELQEKSRVWGKLKAMPPVID
jgi:hypothetical protein